jgi:tetratricopeptide (TPR) repeat protein
MRHTQKNPILKAMKQVRGTWRRGVEASATAMRKVRSIQLSRRHQLIGGSALGVAVVAAALAFSGLPDWAVIDGARDAVFGERSVTELQKAVAAQPKDTDRRVDLGHALFDGGKRQQALIEYDRALQLDRGAASGRVVNNLLACFGKGEQPSAEAIISQYKLGSAEGELRDLTEHRSHYVRAAALRCLDKLGEIEREDFYRVHLADLGEAECDVRKNAVKRLAELGDTRAIKPIQKAREKDIEQTPWFAFRCLGGDADDALAHLSRASGAGERKVATK